MHINDAWYFPLQLRIVAGAMVRISVALASPHPVLAIFLMLGALLVLSSYYGFSIDLTTRTYCEYTSWLGMKVGQPKKFESVVHLFIKPMRVSRTYNLRGNSTTIHDTEYDGYLRLSGNTVIHIFRASRKEKVVKRLNELKAYLGTEVVDHTEMRSTGS